MRPIVNSPPSPSLDLDQTVIEESPLQSAGQNETQRRLKTVSLAMLIFGDNLPIVRPSSSRFRFIGCHPEKTRFPQVLGNLNGVREIRGFRNPQFVAGKLFPIRDRPNPFEFHLSSPHLRSIPRRNGSDGWRWGIHGGQPRSIPCSVRASAREIANPNCPSVFRRQIDHNPWI